MNLSESLNDDRSKIKLIGFLGLSKKCKDLKAQEDISLTGAAALEDKREVDTTKNTAEKFFKRPGYPLVYVGMDNCKSMIRSIMVELIERIMGAQKMFNMSRMKREIRWIPNKMKLEGDYWQTSQRNVKTPTFWMRENPKPKG